MTLSFQTISNTIAALSVSGVTLKDIDEVPTTGDRVPIILPRPDFITNFGLVEEETAMGAPSVRPMTVRYTLNYRLLFKEAGVGRSNTIEALNGLTEKIGLFLDAVLAMDDTTGVEDLVPSANAVTNMGLVNAPNDEEYYGCDFHLDITEHVN